MEKLGGEYLKVGVMGKNKEDVVDLLEGMSVSCDNRRYKVMGICMSDVGLVSGVGEGVFGG
ncbi:type I 3-dehydroquinate dehydratase [Staphylococcus capitis]|uniref:type I 3-dehydroquinate dehydratase n=1 Tax=Staphylococcus capitis TaxID=29388 RepID=UPI0021B27875|nr:type I 3-dehydroquinate dehydratase [Staphylococcus capitis]